MAKKFFYVCMGLLALAGAYHLGAESVVAQTPGDPILWANVHGGDGTGMYCDVVTVGGEIYRGKWDMVYPASGEVIYVGSVYGGVIGNSPGSLGDVKSLFR